ncbi:hypothetical protein P1X14_02685 [Sphingomonas sp. AOB5]|uniref:hypothetical protein n=1 Tax=Sphingomonas sp. AOB5 TaxID=3034017 RepID=UPI0023F8FE70|nr:hypothetical protein [Sphingomonas sp. AOB5]MDF7774142.1 hypothetical protein [Sphingomonas sp. AOB5]
MFDYVDHYTDELTMSAPLDALHEATQDEAEEIIGLPSKLRRPGSFWGKLGYISQMGA